jgi:hypothetical protein
MERAKRITAKVPESLLRAATQATRKNITETVVEGLRLIRRAHAYETAMALRGKVRLEVDVDEARGRRRR